MAQDPAYSVTKAILEEITEPLKEFLSKILGPPSSELGEFLADRVRLWRFKQAMHILVEAQTILRSLGVNPQKVNLKTLIPIIEFGSLEEDESMQRRWASLLANAANPKYSPSIPPAFPEILKQLSPNDALVLDNIFDTELPKLPADRISWESGGVYVNGLESALGISHDEIVFTLDNLHRLGLCAPPTPPEGASGYARSNQILEYYGVYLTAIGASFVKACRASIPTQ